MGLRLLLAVWLGKLAVRFSRALGGGGSTMPGRVALIVDPLTIRKLAHQCRRGAILVTGTNGKTTTSKMVSDILRRARYRVVHNRSGANLIYGVAAAFVQAANLLGRIRADYALVEVDEGTVRRVVDQLPLKAVLVTNFFRDQLDRFGELDHTVQLVSEGLSRAPYDVLIALNADDPLVAGLGPGRPQRILYYGIEDSRYASPTSEQSREIKPCQSCGATLKYDGFFYAHLGRYRCPHCGQTRPAPTVSVQSVTLRGVEGSDLSIGTDAGVFKVTITFPGLYNIYNALAAAAVTHGLGIPDRTVAAGLSTSAGSFGRMEVIRVAGKRVLLALVKNPAGIDAVIRTVLEDPHARHMVIAINDRFADGTDVSWLWDGDFERLAASGNPPESIITSGLRAADMAVRLKYAGYPSRRITIKNNLDDALQEGLARVEPGETLYFLPTYTAMLEVREAIRRRGYARHFWRV